MSFPQNQFQLRYFKASMTHLGVCTYSNAACFVDMYAASHTSTSTHLHLCWVSSISACIPLSSNATAIRNGGMQRYKVAVEEPSSGYVEDSDSVSTHIVDK